MSTQTLIKEPHTKQTTERFPDRQTIVKNSSGKNTAQEKTTPPQTNTTLIEQWLNLSRDQLDDIYKRAKPGPLPHGDTVGTAILAGGPFSQLFAKIAKAIAWQGKVFDLFTPSFNSGVVVNKVSPFGVNLIVAKIYRGESWMDGEDTIIIDYSGTSLFAKQIRDEMREVVPGLYLGKVWWGKTRVLDFALETHQVMPS